MTAVVLPFRPRVHLPIAGQSERVRSPSERIAALTARLGGAAPDGRPWAERAKEHNRRRSRRRREVRAKTVNVAKMPKGVLSLDSAIADLIFDEIGPVERPKTRAECVGDERPCPWISCRHHLFLEVAGNGSIKFNFPDIGPGELEKMPATCSLDVADAGPVGIDRGGELLNLTRERFRQLEVKGIESMRRRAARLHLVDFIGHARDVGESPFAEMQSEGGGADAGEPDDVEPAVGDVWDLSQPETPERERAAQRMTFRAYMTDSQARGFEHVPPTKFTEKLRAAEEKLASGDAVRLRVGRP